jgi:hypothetical protein
VRRMSWALWLAALAACFSHTPPQPPTPRDATQVNASMGRSWDAVIDLFAARTIPIRTIERASGIIVMEQLSVGEEGIGWADCGKVAGIPIAPNYATANVLVRGDSTRSTVKTTVRWVKSSIKERLIKCSTSHVWELALEAGVKTRAEDQKVASASTEERSAYASDASPNSVAERRRALPAVRPRAPRPIPLTHPPREVRPQLSNHRPRRLLLGRIRSSWWIQNSTERCGSSWL